MTVCEKCWAEAQRRHAAGEGETVIEVYNRLLSDDWCFEMRLRESRARERD